MVYQVLDKDTIINEILPHLSVAKRGFKTASSLIEVVNSILYKLKTGCQWHMLPVRSLFSKVVLSYKTVSCPVAGNHNDLYKIEESVKGLAATLQNAEISLDGLFLNADSGFDPRSFRSVCNESGIIPNVAFNYLNAKNKDEYLLDDLLLKAKVCY
jgi:hypothetical protein